MRERSPPVGGEQTRTTLGAAPQQILRRRWHPSIAMAPITSAWIRSRADGGVRRAGGRPPRCWLPWRTPGRAPSRRRARRTRRACHRLILVDQLDRQIARELKRLGAHHPYVPLLMTAPGVGWLVGFSIATVIGDIERFSSPSKLRGYTRKAARSLARLAIPEFVQP